MDDHLNELLELVRRHDEANGADPVPDQVKKACIVSNTPEPMKAHLQLNVGELGNFDALRVATEDYLRSRRIFKTTASVNTLDHDLSEVSVLSGKGRGKTNSARARKGKKTTLAKVTVSNILRPPLSPPRFEGEFPNCGKYVHKAADCWHTQLKSQGTPVDFLAGGRCETPKDSELGQKLA